MTTIMRIEEMRRLFSEAKNAEDFQAILLEAKREEAEPNLGFELELLRGEAIKSLLRFSSDSPNNQWQIVQQEVLPLCLRSTWPAHLSGWTYNEVLRGWLEGLESDTRADYRDRVILTTIAALKNDSARAACDTVAALGYRNKDTTSALDQLIANSDDETGDVALGTRLALGVPSDELVRLEGELCRRIASGRWSQSLVGAAHALATPSLLQVLAQTWLYPSFLAARIDKDSFLVQQTLLLLPAIADRATEDSDVQDVVWRMLLGLRPHCQETFNSLLNLNGQFGQLCNTPGVVAVYLEMLGADHPIVRYRGGLRLNECVRPRQLSGWEEAETVRLVFRSIEADATASSGMEGHWSSLELDLKRDSCETLLSLGDFDAFQRSILALTGEKNGFAMAQVLEIAACFPLAHLPQVVPDLIAARFGEIPEEGNQRIAAQISAIHVAHAAVSSEAFTSLLGYVRYQVPGVLIRLVDALADCALALAHAGDRVAVDTLLSIAQGDSTSSDRRDAAAAAVARVVRNMPEAVAPGSLSELVRDRTLHDLVRRSLLDAMGYFGVLPDGEASTSFLRAIALGTEELGPPKNGEYLGSWEQIALRALARQGRLARDDELIGRSLGLVQGKGGWGVGDLYLAERGSVTAGLLFVQNPGAFAPVVAALLKHSSWPLVAQLLPWIHRVLPAPDPVAAALAERAARSREGKTAEPELFRVLATVAPHQLANGPWDGLMEWPAPARIALADALRRTGQLGVNANHRRQETLVNLMGDGQYLVRHAAYRAMGTVAPSVLAGLCSGWAFSDDEELRCRASEAISWVSAKELSEIRSSLRDDRSRSVREAYARCEGERRERGWAALYASRVNGVTSGGLLLEAWRFGKALAQLGDDETLERLDDRRRDEKLLPSVRYWLGRLADGVRKHWEEFSRKWSNHRFLRRGALEAVYGVFRTPDGKVVSFRGWLWHDAADEPIGFSSWGGWSEEVSADIPLVDLGMELDGKKPARVRITSASLPAQAVAFVGIGAYPEETKGTNVEGSS
jgi:hypothetical protein